MYKRIKKRSLDNNVGLLIIVTYAISLNSPMLSKIYRLSTSVLLMQDMPYKNKSATKSYYL